MEEHEPYARTKKPDSNREKRRLIRDREKSDIAFILSDARGRRFMWRLLSMTGIYRSSYTGDSKTFFREGERNIGLQVMRDIHEINPEAMTQMLKEAQLDSGHEPDSTNES